jgi:hypothetical protein
MTGLYPDFQKVGIGYLLSYEKNILDEKFSVHV